MKAHDLYQEKLSIIIPAINEEANIGATLKSVYKASNVEVILANGGSEDKTTSIAMELGAKVVVCEKGRARQMNYGASFATGTLLLFLHADTVVTEGFDTSLRQILQNPETAAGAFRLRIASPKIGFRILEKLVNLRSQLFQMPYGDQGIFIRAEKFHELGGFPCLPIMEDFVFIRRLKSHGRIVISLFPVITSARRWEKLGIIKATFINQLIITAFHLGINRSKLAAWYYQSQD